MNKKNYFLLTIFLIISSFAYAESCYLYIEKSGGQNRAMVLQVSIVQVSQFIEPVEAIPTEPIGSEACLYELNLMESSRDGFFLTITGKGLNAYGDSKLKGFDGVQQALLRAIYRAKPKKKQAVCQLYLNLLSQDCGEVSSVGSSSNSKEISSPSKHIKPDIVSVSEEVRGVLFSLKSCKRSGQKVTCYFTLTSQNEDGLIYIGRSIFSDGPPGNGFRIFDDLGVEYLSSQIAVTNKTSNQAVQTKLIVGIHTKGSVTFEKFSNEARMISMMEIVPYVNGKRANIKFRNIPIK